MQPQPPELSFRAIGDDPERGPVDHLPVEISCRPVPAATTAVLSVGGEELGAPSTRLGEQRWRWEWNPRGRAGTFAVRLVVRSPDAPDLVGDAILVVRPAKL